MSENKDVLPCGSIEEIVDTYGDIVFRIVLQHMRNEAEAQDVLQEVFMKIIKKAPVFESAQKEKAWILRVAMNTCKDHWKYERLRKHSELLDSYPSYIESDTSFYILPYVLKLPPKYRDVIYLYYYEEYSVKEIADILNRKQSTILTWLKRAKAKLKVQLKGSDGNETL